MLNLQISHVCLSPVIVEPQALHQDGLNSLSYHNGLKTPIIIANVYNIF